MRYFCLRVNNNIIKTKCKRKLIRREIERGEEGEGDRERGCRNPKHNIMLYTCKANLNQKERGDYVKRWRNVPSKVLLTRFDFNP